MDGDKGQKGMDGDLGLTGVDDRRIEVENNRGS